MPPAYADALQTFGRDRLPGLRRRLARRFPTTPEAQVEEALQEALVDACAPERQAWFVEGYASGGADELARRIFTAAWRHLRGDLRRVGHQRTDRMATGFDAAEADGGPEAEAEARQTMSWLQRRVGDAAARFGRRRASTLERALRSMIGAGHPVKPLAERYRLPRRYLAEASQWLRHRLASRADESQDP